MINGCLLMNHEKVSVRCKIKKKFSLTTNLKIIITMKFCFFLQHFYDLNNSKVLSNKDGGSFAIIVCSVYNTSVTNKF